MPPDLSVDLKREFMLSVVLHDASVVLQRLLTLGSEPRFTCVVPPGVKVPVADIRSQFLGLGFPGVYIGLEDDPEVLADVGVVTVKAQGCPPHAYFSGGRSGKGKALVAALAIAVAKLVGNSIEDSIGHWMPREVFTAEELESAMKRANLSEPENS